MKTLLFIDKGEGGLWPSFLKYDFLLDEFRRDGLFDVCEWKAEGNSVATALPDLAAVLGDETEWQAFVVCDLRRDARSLRDDLHFDNPFDFPNRYGATPDDGLQESPNALVRLTQMLGGFPDKMLIRWPSEDAGPFKLRGYEMSYAANEGRYDMIDRYRLGLPRPQRIVCISPRDVDAAFFDLRSREICVSEVREDFDFWQRNDYPSTARFVVCDRQAPALRSCDLNGVSEEEFASSFSGVDNGGDWFEFWMCVLTLMVSSVEPSDLRAFKVHRMSVDIDDVELVDMLARRRAQWLAACHAIGERLHYDAARLKASEYVMTELPNTKVSIPITFDQVKASHLHTDPSEVRLIKDRPKNDKAVWFAQKARIADGFRELLRAPRRALYHAAAKYRSAGPVPPEELEYCVLNEYQKDGLADELRAMEYELACDVGRPPFETESHREVFDECSAAIEAEIGKRPVERQVKMVALVTAACLLVGFMPFAFGVVGSFAFNPAALLAFVGCAGVLAVVGFVTLLLMRSCVRAEYRAHDEVMAEIVANLASEAKRLEVKVSSYAAYRKKWSIYERQLHLVMPTAKANLLGYRSALLRMRIQDIDEIARDCEVAMVNYVTDFDSDWDQVSQLLEDESFYSLCDVAQRGRSVCMNDGVRRSFADLPYRFIRSASLEPIRVE